jgi:hypothetical protein
MKVENMTSKNGNYVPNQFIITDDDGCRYFQSYSTIIAKVCDGVVTLDTRALDYSRTTSKYLYTFLNRDRKGILANDSIVWADLN